MPPADRLALAQALDLEVLPEESALPMLLHQKLSAIMAREIFGVDDPAILSAVGCHTTLKANATPLDKAVFVADKLAWDQPGVAPFHAAVRDGLDTSLDAAALAYLRHLWEHRQALAVIHPWMVEAYQELEHQNS